MKTLPPFLTVALLGIVVLLAGCPRPPAAPERPWGESTGLRNVPVSCSTRMPDPADGEVSYQFDWGDGSQSEWSPPQPAGTAFGDTHTYTRTGSFGVRARARFSRGGASEWSEDFTLRVGVGEGEVLTRFGLRDPDDEYGEDSADFSLNTFALGPDGRSYVGSEFGFLFRNPEGRRDKEFFTRDLDGFFPAPTLSDDGVIYIACENETLYAFNAAAGTRRWTAGLGDEVYATAALGADGTIYVQTVSDSLYAFAPDGTRRWSFPSQGNSSPVVGPDGTVYVCSDAGRIFAVDPTTGAEKNSYGLGPDEIHGSPALDPGRNRLCVADESGNLVALNLTSFTGDWHANVGQEPSSPVIGADGTVFIGGGGGLHALDPADGSVRWTFEPPIQGVVSTPAVSEQDIIYIVVGSGRRLARGLVRGDALFDVDSLYAVNADGSRRWAVGLDWGFADYITSSPKIDAEGYVYVGNGYLAWVVRGLGGPAPSPWPMFQRDGRNTGRAGN